MGIPDLKKGKKMLGRAGHLNEAILITHTTTIMSLYKKLLRA